MKKFKKVYISHPLRGDMDLSKPNLKIPYDNMQKVDNICRRIADEHPDLLLLSPIHAFAFLNVFADDEKALEMDRVLLELADELWVFGEWQTSEGCQMEIKWARELVIPIIYETGESECPKKYRCGDSDFILYERAWNIEQAADLLGCHNECHKRPGCRGPVEYTG